MLNISRFVATNPVFVLLGYDKNFLILAFNISIITIERIFALKIMYMYCNKFEIIIAVVSVCWVSRFAIAWCIFDFCNFSTKEKRASSIELIVFLFYLVVGALCSSQCLSFVSNG